jgi:hypothetical protein
MAVWSLGNVRKNERKRGKKRNILRKQTVK